MSSPRRYRPEARPPEQRPYRFVYDPDESAELLLNAAELLNNETVGTAAMETTTTARLDARGDFFLWAFLQSEVVAFVAKVHAVIGDHIAFVLDNEREHYGRDAAAAAEGIASESLLLESKATSARVTMTLADRGFPHRQMMTIEFGLTELSGVCAECKGFPAGTRAPFARGPTNIDDARAAAVDLVSRAAMMLAPHLDPFPGTAHAGKAIDKILAILPRPTPNANRAPARRPR